MKLLRWRDRYFKWNYGRQRTGYEVMTFVNSEFFNCDCHLLRYGVGHSIPPHRDPVGEHFNHFRMNIVLWPAKEGGEFVCKEVLFRFGPIVLFRPDEQVHAVTELKQGCRYVLSVGWKRRKKK